MSAELFRLAADRSSEYPRENVLAVRCKSGLAMARAGSVIHRVRFAAAVLEKSGVRYGARWECGAGSIDIVLLPSDVGNDKLCWRCANPPEIGLYRCLSGDGLLYLGSTKDLAGRLRSHAKRKPWWPDVTEVKCTPFGTIGAARAAEALAIRTEMPRYNRRGIPTPAELAVAALRDLAEVAA